MRRAPSGRGYSCRMLEPERITAHLPRGYRARAFVDVDREPIVEAGNAEAHPMEAQTADEWRRWEALFEDRTRERVTVLDASGAVVGAAEIHAGPLPRPDGSQTVHVSVHRSHRRRRIGGVLLEELEAEGRRRGLARLLAGASAALPEALAWARTRGYEEIGRRIMSYRELDSFEPAAWRAATDRAAREGIRIRSFAEVLGERDEAGRDRFWYELWQAEGPMWEDIPSSTPSPHWPYERFLEMNVKSGQLLPDVSLVAFDGDAIVGVTTTGDRQHRDGWTWLTGVAREHRGRGLAMALKVDALTRAKAEGLRAMCTVNDEANRAMRGVNIRLGYQPVPDHVELAKALS